jgi:predicted nucleotidyltransferase
VSLEHTSSYAYYFLSIAYVLNITVGTKYKIAMAKRSIHRKGFSHQQIGIEFKEETHEVLHV